MSSNKDTKVHVVCQGSSSNHSVKTELKMSSNIHVGMKNTKEGKHMFMYVVLHGTAQIPVGKAQDQAQNRLK